MRDFAFYNAGGPESSSLQRWMAPFRRALRYVLRPIFYRLAELMREMDGDLDTVARTQQQLTAEVERMTHTLTALRTELQDVRKELLDRREAAEWKRRLERLEGLEEDHIAAMRRLAVLEDRVEIHAVI